MKATISQAEAAMTQFSEQSQAVQDELLEEGKRKLTKLKEQQKKKIAQLKADHCAVIEGVYSRYVVACVYASSRDLTRVFPPAWSKWWIARKRTKQVSFWISSEASRMKLNKA